MIHTSAANDTGKIRRPFILLFLIVSTVYYASNYPIAASNEGAHFALIRAIVDEGRFRIDTYLDAYTGRVDFAVKNGAYYSDRAPGVAFLGVPFYTVGFWVAKATGWNLETVGKHFVSLLPIWVGTAAVILLILILLRLGISETTAWIVGLLYAFAGMHWKFSAQMFNHVFSEFWLLALFLLMLDGVRLTERTSKSYAFAFLCGYFPLIDYPAALILPLVLVFLFLAKNSRVLPRDEAQARAFAVNTALFLLPILLLGYYHTVCFGAPWRTFAKFHNPEMFGFFTSFKTMFDVPLKVGATALLFRIPDPYPYGLFILHPYLLFGLFGWWWFFKERRGVALFSLVLAVGWICFYGKFHTYDGGSSGDPRYLLTILPVFYITLAYWLDRFPEKIKDVRMRILALLPFAVLVIAGFFASLIHFAEYFGHDFDFRKNIDHFSLISAPAMRVLLPKIFVSAHRLHWYFLTLAGFAGILAAAGRIFMHKAETKKPEEESRASER